MTQQEYVSGFRSLSALSAYHSGVLTPMKMRSESQSTLRLYSGSPTRSDKDTVSISSFYYKERVRHTNTQTHTHTHNVLLTLLMSDKINRHTLCLCQFTHTDFCPVNTFSHENRLKAKLPSELETNLTSDL